MKPFKKLSAYDNVPCEYLSSTSGAGWYLTKEQQDAMERMLEGMSETLIPEIDVAALKSENAKLRELVVALQHCRDGRCDGECPMFTPADNNRGVPPVCEAYGVMRELGIEVDNDHLGEAVRDARAHGTDARGYGPNRRVLLDG